MQLFIDGKLVQEAKVEDMIHNVWELIEYGSSIVTLHPGDVINGGHDLRHVDGSHLRRDPLGLSEAGRGDGGEDRRDRDASQPGRRRSGAGRPAAAHSSRRSPATKRNSSSRAASRKPRDAAPCHRERTCIIG